VQNGEVYLFLWVRGYCEWRRVLHDPWRRGSLSGARALGQIHLFVVKGWATRRAISDKLAENVPSVPGLLKLKFSTETPEHADALLLLDRHQNVKEWTLLSTRNFLLLFSEPPGVVTVTNPVVAPAGTVAVK